MVATEGRFREACLIRRRGAYRLRGQLGRSSHLVETRMRALITGMQRRGDDRRRRMPAQIHVRQKFMLGLALAALATVGLVGAAPASGASGAAASSNSKPSALQGPAGNELEERTLRPGT